ncbi:RNA polymerase sigma-70 factor [Larkinella rosea]|uniref:RNA polymerase sigma-70 factor n=1 Tax=Larkinella rosea TaxID=2025312 RepID=A0A3P1BDC7_9BACT|nr:RNA polymerase sigma-70 factor [Larkinella rosea]RRA99137.1 RNA polymerase sigma-70 factor [Larkinella rosea]
MQAEQTLLRQLRNADPTAFRRVYDRYVQRIYYFTVSFLKSPETAQQIVSDVFTTLWERRSTLDEDIPLNGYLFTMTYGLVLAAFRERHSQCQPQEILQRLTTQSGTDTEEQVLYQELELLYQQAVSQLPPRRREIYLLSRHEGYTSQQIADRMNLSTRTIEDHLDQSYDTLGTYFQRHTY